MKRIIICLLTVLAVVCISGVSLAYTENEKQEILDQAAALDAELGNLRSVVVHVYSGEETVEPSDGDEPASAFLKNLAIALGKRWELAENESSDMTLSQKRDLYRRCASAELEILARDRDEHLDDALLDLLRSVYLIGLDGQLQETEKNYTAPDSFLWHWNEYRQTCIKSLYFINRYYALSVRKTDKDFMNSYMYEGALLIDENTVGELIDFVTENSREGGKTEELDADQVSSGTNGGTWDEKGDEKWYTDPSGAYALRIHDYDSVNLSMKADLRETATGKDVLSSIINLSGWEKYSKDRWALDTFYKVGNVVNLDGKISFELHMNAFFDGRPYKELKGNISLKIPAAKSGTASSGSMAEEQIPGNMSEAEFPEDPIKQNFSALNVGDKILMGYYEQDGDAENLREPIQWNVVSVNKKKNVALVVTTYGIEAISYGKPGDESQYLEEGFNWKNAYLRQWLNGEFYGNAFTQAEKARIRTVANITEDKSGRFKTNDQVFILSTTEVRRYLQTTKGMSCEATEQAKKKMVQEAITEDGYCLWWLRDMLNVAVKGRNGEYKKNRYNEAGYVFGSKGLQQYLRKKGGKVYQDDLIAVRPAMWIKFDP